ncbi:hypothetical protein ACOMHN_056065 [Nucella lapillus]
MVKAATLPHCRRNGEGSYLTKRGAVESGRCGEGQTPQCSDVSQMGGEGQTPQCSDVSQMGGRVRPHSAVTSARWGWGGEGQTPQCSDVSQMGGGGSDPTVQ